MISKDDDEDNFIRECQYSPLIKEAWNLYCKENDFTATAADFWRDLNTEIQNIYIVKVINKK